MIIERHCPHCSQPILEGAVFCLDCGGRVLGGATTAGGVKPASRIQEVSDIDDVTGLARGSYLFVVEGVDRGRRFDLIGQTDFKIGREGADFQLQDPFSSRAHARIVADGRRWLIYDNHSVNGTLVNHMGANGQELLDGDVIELGYTTLVFRVKI